MIRVITSLLQHPPLLLGSSKAQIDALHLVPLGDAPKHAGSCL